MPIGNRRKITLSQRTYELLVRDLRKLLVVGKQRAEAVAGRELVPTMPWARASSRPSSPSAPVTPAP
ncbi:MAG: hypothetical protein JRH20_01715 [Deltaproteobacteria bacterium]|nr:hypothetical protein [Deltaproteobacteria bacterium]